MRKEHHQRLFVSGFSFPGFVFCVGRPWRFGSLGHEEYRRMIEDYRRDLKEELRRV